MTPGLRVSFEFFNETLSSTNMLLFENASIPVNGATGQAFVNVTIKHLDSGFLFAVSLIKLMLPSFKRL